MLINTASRLSSRWHQLNGAGNSCHELIILPGTDTCHYCWFKIEEIIWKGTIILTTVSTHSLHCVVQDTLIKKAGWVTWKMLQKFNSINWKHEIIFQKFNFWQFMCFWVYKFWELPGVQIMKITKQKLHSCHLLWEYKMIMEKNAIN